MLATAMVPVPSPSVRVSGNPRAAQLRAPRAGFAGTPTAVWSARGGGGVVGRGGRRAAGGVWVAAGREQGREDQRKQELKKMEQQMGKQDGKPEVKASVQSAPMPAPFGVPLPTLGGGFIIAAVIFRKVLGGRNKGYAHPSNLTPDPPVHPRTSAHN